MIEEQKDNTNIEEESLEFMDFLKRVPQETIDFILADQTAEKIADICKKNGIDDETRIEGIAYRTVLVLSGDLPSGNLALTFELGLKLPNELSRKIADEINQFIVGKIAQPTIETTALSQEKIAVEEKPKKSPNKDTYREQI